MPKRVILNGKSIYLFNLEEAAAFLGVSTRTLRQYAADERLPACRLKRRLYFTSTNLSAFLKGAASTRRKTTVAAPQYDVPSFDTTPPDPWLSDT